jgi:hypothetical protein
VGGADGPTGGSGTGRAAERTPSFGERGLIRGRVGSCGILTRLKRLNGGPRRGYGAGRLRRRDDGTISFPQHHDAITEIGADLADGHELPRIPDERPEETSNPESLLDLTLLTALIQTRYRRAASRGGGRIAESSLEPWKASEAWGREHCRSSRPPSGRGWIDAPEHGTGKA